MSKANQEVTEDCDDYAAEQLTQPIFKNDTYDNPWPTWSLLSFGKFFKWRLFESVNNTNLPSDRKILDQTLPVHTVTQEDIDDFYKDTSNQIKLLWIGHATCLINIENCVVLIDPVFSPSQLIGPKRFRPVPITVDELPRVDAVIISHNHYDHLDYNSVRDLHEKFGKTGDGISWFVGAGLKSWFSSCGINRNVTELSWWQHGECKNIQFVFTIAQHWSARGLTDRCKTLWGSWTLIGPNKRFFFAGDTGYCSSFKEVGQKYGPFDLSAIPIGAYEPRCIMQAQHVDPDQAVQIHIDVKSKKSIGVHWGTFALANEYYLEPISKLKEALKKYELKEDAFVTLEHGQTFKT